MMTQDEAKDLIYMRFRAIGDACDRINGSTDIQYIDQQEINIFIWLFQIKMLVRVFPELKKLVSWNLQTAESIEFKGSIRVYKDILKKAEI